MGGRLASAGGEAVTPETRAARDRLARFARPDFPMPAPDLPDALGPFTAAQLNRVTDELMRGVQETLAPDIHAVLAALDMPCALITCEHILTEQAADDLKRRFLEAQHDGTPIRVLDDPDAEEQPHRLTVRLIPHRGLHGEDLGLQPYRELHHTRACDRLGYGQRCPFDTHEGTEEPTGPGEYEGYYWAGRSWTDSGWEYDASIQWERTDTPDPQTSDDSAAKDTQ